MIGTTAAIVVAISAINVFGESSVVGQPAPSFAVTDIQGRLQRLADYKDKIVVLHFQSCACPWDAAYQPILNRLARRFTKIRPDGTVEETVKFLAINSNHSESVGQIKQYAAEFAIPYPILKDVGNQIADAYGAMTTPHMFVINRDGQQTLAYKGGIEEAPLSPPHCGESQHQYLETVLLSLVDGATPPYSETQSAGCSIKRDVRAAIDH